MIALVLAAALTFPPGAEVVHISEDAWPEKRAVEKLRTGERLWWWSDDCAPQRLTADDTIECKQPTTRVVEVVDRDSGKKLPNARVVWGTDSMLADIPDAMLPAAITDADGRVMLHMPDGEVRIRVDGPRVASWWQHVQTKIAAVSAAPQSLKMNVDGDPASFALVQFELPGLGGGNGVRSWAIARDGVIALPALPPVPLTLIAWSRASSPVAMNVDASTMPRTLDLPRGTDVIGRVIDSRRRPLEGTAIEAVFPIANLPRGLRRRAQTTRDGTFIVRGIPAGPAQLTFRKAERATLLRGIDTATTTDLGDITLRPSRSIAVRVIDADGAPVAGAKVRAAEGASATTSRDGTARLDSIAADDEVALHVTASGFLAHEASVDPDAKSPLVIELSRGVRVTGTVVRAGTGQPAGPGEVLVINNGGQQLKRFDENGAIDIGGLEAGTLALEIRAPGVRPHAIAQRPILADETWHLGTLELSDGALLTGTVVDRENDAPLSGVRVRALRPRAMGAAVAVVMNDWIETTSREDGTFRVSGLTAGPHVVMFDAAGFAPRVLDATAQEKDAEAMKIELDRARVLNIECTPVARCGSDVRLLYAGSTHPWASTPATLHEGKARIVTAAPGAAVLRFVRGGAIVHERPVQIGTASETAIKIALVTATLRGTVTTAGHARGDRGIVELRSRAMSGDIPVYVEHRTPDGLSTGGAWQSEIPSFAIAPVDEHGRFIFEELNPGEYEAVYRGDTLSSKAFPIVVRPGASHITLDVPASNEASNTSAP